MTEVTPGTPVLARRVGEIGEAYPHIEVPFTAADREALMEIRDVLCGIQMLIDNFNMDDVLAKVLGGGGGAGNPMTAILGALVR